MKKLNITKSFMLRLTAEDEAILEALKKELGVTSNTEAIRMMLLDRVINVSLPKKLPKSADRREEPVLSPPEKKPEPPPKYHPSFLPKTQKKITIEDLMNDGLSRMEASARVMSMNSKK